MNTETDAKPSASRSGGRLKLLLLASLFFGPLVVAWVWYFAFPESTPTSRSNRGHLVTPARPLPERVTVSLPSGEAAGRDEFEARWSMLYVDDSACEEPCAERLYEMRQVWASLHRNIGRVQRVYVTSASLPEGGVDALTEVPHKDLKSLIDSQGQIATFIDDAVDDPDRSGYIYLLDPLGNLVLYFKPGEPLKDMLKDIKRLLKLSHIG